jgi:DUF4097 and DUF4098 domain-containing protein YvlB
MNLKSIQWIYFMIILFILFLNSCSAMDFTDTVEKNFTVHEGGNLKLESDLGSINIITGSNNQVEVIIKRKVDDGDRDVMDSILEDLVIDFDQKNDDVYIRVEYDRGGFFRWRKNRLQLQFDITVPEKYNVDLRTAGGSITVADLQGEVHCSTSGGSIKLGDIKGAVWSSTSGGSISLTGSVGSAELSTSGGNINIGYVDGTVEASTSGGSINIEQAKAAVSASTSGGGIHVKEVMGSINGSTSGGSITVNITSQPAADCKLTTSGGGINIYLKSEIKANINAATSGGKVVTDFPITVRGELSKSKLKAQINGGGPELYLRTSGGNIYLHEM